MSNNCATPDPVLTPEEINKHIQDFDILDYLLKMENRNKIFYSIVSMTHIMFTKSIPTLCVGYDKRTHDVVMRINPQFFFTKNMEERIFLLSHEAMHVILQHLDVGDFNTINNIAQDIVINESLLHDFVISRRKLEKVLASIPLVDNIFSPEEIKEHNIVKNGTWMYYRNLIEKLKPEIKQNCCDRDKANQGGKIPDYVLDDILQDALSKLSDEELEELDYDAQKLAERLFDNKKAGKGALGELINVTLEKRKKKVNWKDILRKHYYRLLTTVEEDKYAFEKISRRNTLVAQSELMIPSVNKTPVKLIRKYDVYFFLDVSGSCLEFSQEFYNFAKTLPTDYCNIHFYSFDTEIYPIKLNTKTLRGGGGTSFDMIESFCASQPEYPNLVFMVTDGFGNDVIPRKPENWVWFLTDHHTEEFINSKSYRHILNEVYK